MATLAEFNAVSELRIKVDLTFVLSTTSNAAATLVRQKPYCNLVRRMAVQKAPAIPWTEYYAILKSTHGSYIQTAKRFRRELVSYGAVVAHDNTIRSNGALRHTVSRLEAENEAFKQREEELLQYLNDAEMLDKLPIRDQVNGLNKEDQELNQQVKTLEEKASTVVLMKTQ
ncbi:MAG: hypothetical protein OHK93_001687 [Ramalina farinacea]|uniref:Uncharacterized protein n=1 Tax=Ramalina farinacea TaxID=258253 RepID=A0AA43TWI3_9LECA|nr:hypothetical protein [Ramalina farinacea]